MIRRSRVALAVLAGLLAHLPGQDELGLGKMWTFERPPLAYLQREYGFSADERWWNTLRLASLRFGRGCSASFVSPQGLILTNHHCARDAISQVQGDSDWVRDGYVASALEDEVKLPGLTVQQLVAMRDVTAAVTEGITADMDSAAAEARREANGEAVLAAARAASPQLQPQLVKLFQGGVWQLYEYRVYDDIRLVMAPHLQVSHFGGDPDNFVYPRYAVDFAFCRAYENGVPADTSAHYFPWGDGPEEGDLVFLTGNPGGTQRLLTKAQLEYQRDARYPRIRELIDARIDIMREMAASDAKLEKALRTRILGFENGQKLYRGEHGALSDPAFMRRKEAAEQAFQERARAGGATDAVWQRIAAVAAKKQALEAPLNFQTTGGSPLLLRAMALVEFAATGDAAKAERAKAVVMDADPLQAAFFVDHLTRAARWLGAEDPYLRALLDGRAPADAARHLTSTSRLADDKVVGELIAGGPAAIDASRDPALGIARALLPMVERNQAALAAIEAEENQLGAELAQLLFATYGNDVTPDATFTLRFSDGRVAGYAYNGTIAPPHTSFYGMFARNSEFGDRHPFDLPQQWLLARERIDPTTPLDFVCTVDSTGGNSGSPLVDKEGHLAGLLFDGNIESLANEFLYGERVERSVCVHPRAIVEALRKVYDARRLLREIGR